MKVQKCLGLKNVHGLTKKKSGYPNLVIRSNDQFIAL